MTIYQKHILRVRLLRARTERRRAWAWLRATGWSGGRQMLGEVVVRWSGVVAESTSRGKGGGGGGFE